MARFLALFLCVILAQKNSEAAEKAFFELNPDSVPVWRGVPFAKEANAAEKAQESADRDSLRLKTSGSKTIQVIVGDGGTEVNQELHLSVQGEATKGVFIDALLSDVGREAGEERTATLQEVDEVHFRIESEHLFLHLGDFTWKSSELGLSGIERKTLGVAAGVKTSHSAVRGAYGFDELESVLSVFNGVDGQQKGYLISTGTSEPYISVVPNSETVYLNGTKLVRGEDYSVNYAGGVLDFLGSRIPGAEDEIRVEFDAYGSSGLQILKAADGKYRGKNLWLDVSAFELSSDTARLRRSTWTESDLNLLKADDGSEFDRADSLADLERPWMLRRVDARARLQLERHWYADGELAYSESDTNIVSSKVGGPSGRAFRWFLSNDSSSGQRFSPVRVEIAGDYLQEGFRQKNFEGTVRNWDSYELRNSWDLDSSKVKGSLRSDDLSLRLRLPASFFLGGEWGYRRSLTAGEGWNSSRSRAFLEHRTQKAESEISFVRVASHENFSTERFQGTLEGKFLTGFVRPFGEASYGIWIKDTSFAGNHSERADAESGVELVASNWNTKAEVFGSRARTGNSFENLEDSLKIAGVRHFADYRGKLFTLSHTLEYKKTDLDTAGASDSWISEESVAWGSASSAFTGKASYGLGLSREVPYVPIYKAVAPGTGDVLFDSLSGVFVEGVDNGNFVYEGMGRSDSADAVRASSATMAVNMGFVPRLLGISAGILRDLEFSFDGETEGRDTTGKTLFLPPFVLPTLRDLSSGKILGEFSVLWSESKNRGSVEYRLGIEAEKRNTSQGYFEDRRWHRLDGIYTGRKKETWELVPGLETVKLETVQDMDWTIYEVTASVRRELPLHLYVTPKGWLRKGSGKDESESLSAFLKQAALTLGFDNESSVRASNEFSATFVSTSNKTLPYQMISGFGKGTTFRNSLSVTVDANEYLSLGLSYVIRFGSAEASLFQKMAMEARAYF